MGLGLAVLSVVVAYLLGSIPVGVVVCKPLGKDPRTVGSGRTGGTNVYRAAGFVPFALTVVGDVLKGYVAVAIAGRLVPAEVYGGYAGWAVALAALAAIVGHNYPVFAGFHGGAGSSPNMGAAFAYDPLVCAVGIVLGAVVLFGVGLASVGSIVLSLAILLGLGWRVIDGVQPPATLVYAVGQFVLVVWALRPNIARLRAGTERRVDFFHRGPRGPEGGTEASA